MGERGREIIKNYNYYWGDGEVNKVLTRQA